MPLTRLELKGTAATKVPDASANPKLQVALDKMLEMMQSELDRPVAPSFSGMIFEHLSWLNIKGRGSLRLKSDYEMRAVAADTLGMAEHWSSEGLYRHLHILQDLVPKNNEAAAHTWIYPFFFHAAAMSPPGKKLVLIPFNPTTAGGFIAYNAITASKQDAKAFLKNPILEDLKNMFFFSEAKEKYLSLDSHIPQAVCKMYAYAKELGKDTTHGVLTDGHNWIFIILKMNPDGNGGVYAKSKPMQLMAVVTPDVKEISHMMCALIAGIIAHWVDHSDEDIGDDDWFTVDWM